MLREFMKAYREFGFKGIIKFLNKLTNTIKSLLVAVMVFLFLFSGIIQAQLPAQATNIEVKTAGSNIVITYDIINCKKNEFFTVSAALFYKSGTKIEARSLSGAMGGRVKGGKVKKIIWAYAKDKIILNEEIYAEIDVIPALSGKKKQLAKKHVKQTPEIRLGKALFLSALYPGWGNSKVTGKKGNLAIGAFAYGSLAAGIFYNYKANSSYDNYLLTYAITERDNYFNMANQNKTIKGAFFIAAGVIWAADIVLTTVQYKKSEKNKLTALTRISVDMDYNDIIDEPVFIIRYRF